MEYEEFVAFPYEGPVLTTTPLPAAYHDELFIPLYFDIFQGKERYLADVEKRIIYTPASFPCQIYKKKEECTLVKDWFSEELEQHTLIKEGSYHKEPYILVER